MLTKVLFSFLLLFYCSSVYSQTYTLNGASNNTTVTTCSGIFLDSGGDGAGTGFYYSNNEDYTITFCSSNGGPINFYFEFLDLELNYDYLSIYDGASTISPELAGSPFNNNDLSGVNITSTGACLTFNFDSDGSITRPGWEAIITCLIPCQNVQGTLSNISPALNNVSGALEVCQGQSVDFTAEGNYPENDDFYNQSDATSSFDWNYGDGTTDSGTSVTHVFDNAGIYEVVLNITDVNGCQNTNEISQLVYVSSPPSFEGTSVLEDEICLGSQNVLTGVVSPETQSLTCDNVDASLVALPDGSGVSYNSSIFLDCFGPGTTLTNINDLEGICLNIEHSYLGDLEIEITCPNNQNVVLLDYPNGGGTTYLGEPVDVQSQPNSLGVGYDYCFTNSPQYGGLSSNLPGTSQPSGDYASDEPLSGLVGCPLNGEWVITITDNINQDNGFLFSWEVNFDPTLLTGPMEFTPAIVSETWTGDPDIISVIDNIATVEPTSIGSACYNYEVMDNFGCAYDTTLCFDVLESSSNLQIDSIPVLCESEGIINITSNAIAGVWTGDVNPDGTFDPSIGAGDYSGTLTLGGGTTCEVSESVNITVNPSPTAVISGSTDLCQGDSTLIQIDFTGDPDWTFEYALDGFSQGVVSTSENPYSFYVNEQGTYSLISLSNASCTGSFSGNPVISISDIPQINNVVETCSADLLTYTISFDITGGDATTYTVMGGTITGSTFTSDPITNGSSYDFSVSDMNNCGTDNVTGSYNCGCAATATISGNVGMCENGSADLSIDFTGVGPWTFTYVYEGSPVETITTPDNPYALSVSAAGDYTLLEVQDVNCIGSVSGNGEVTLFDVPQPTMIQESCSSDSLSYTVSFEITGGNASTYLVTGLGTLTGSTFVSEPILNYANYDFEISDTNNCGTSSVSGTYSCGCPATAAISGNVGMCENGSADLSIDFEGTGPWTFTYAYDGNPVETITTADNPYLLSVSAAGDYTLLEVQDVNCIGSVSGIANIYLFETPQISNVLETCSADLLTYTISFDISGGDATTYTVMGGTITGSTFTSDPINNGDSYEYNVSDINNCGSGIVSSSYNCGCLATSNISGDLSLCDGINGEIEITFEGIGPWTFDYSLDNVPQGQLTVNDNPYLLQVSTPGVYEITNVADINCEGETYGTVNVIESVSPTANFLDDISFCEGETGVLNLELTGEGPWDVVYAIDGVDQSAITTSDNANNIDCSIAGNYTIIYLMDQNCSTTSTANADVVVHELPEATIGGDIVICENDAGSLVIELTGTPDYYLTYAHNGIEQDPISTSEPTAFELLIEETGNYELLTVEDAHCVGIASGVATAEIASLPTAYISGDFTICDGDQQLIPITLTGEPDWLISYNIDGFPQTPVNTSSTSFDLPAVASGEYEITSVQDLHCSNDGEGTAEINYYPPITVDFSSDVNACFGDEATVWSSAEGGIGAPYEYLWVADNLVELNDTMVSIYSEENTSIMLTVTDDCDYSSAVNIPITINQLPPIGIDGLQTSCGPEFIQINNTTPSSYVGDTCLWIINEDSIYDNNSSIDYYFSEPGFYDVSLLVVSPQGCHNSMDFNDYFEVFPLPTTAFTFSPNEPDIINSEVHFVNESSDDVTFNTWSFGDEYFSTETAPSYIFPTDNGPDNWLVCLTVENDFGCQDSICDIVVIKPGILSHIPNSFSPDGDGLNELFFPVLNGVDAAEYDFRIYDRGGSLVYKTNDLQGKWNGSNFNNDEYFVQDGFYSWQITAKLIGSTDKKTINGAVLVIR